MNNNYIIIIFVAVSQIKSAVGTSISRTLQIEIVNEDNKWMMEGQRQIDRYVDRQIDRQMNEG